MEHHVIARFITHEDAERAAAKLEERFPGRVSFSSKTPRERWWQGDWVDRSLEALGGLAATASQLVPGFGVLFMGGPLDGLRQGEVLSDWLQAHAPGGVEDEVSFLIVSATAADVEDVIGALKAHGGRHVYISNVL